MFSGGKKQTSDIKVVTMLSRTTFIEVPSLKSMLFYSNSKLFSKFALPWSHLQLESPQNFIT